MGNLVYRIIAIVTVVLGLGVTVFALMAAYRTDDDWARVLFTLGLPSSLLLPAINSAREAARASRRRCARENGGSDFCAELMG